MKSRIFMNELVVSVDLTKEELKKVERFAPESLKIIDKETKCETFIVTVSDDPSGSLGKYGVCFNLENEGRALVKAPVCGETLEEKKHYAAENYGAVLTTLVEIEKTAKNALKKINDEIKAVEETIGTIEV